MMQLRGVVDPKVLSFISDKKMGDIIAARPCPIGLRGKINPHVTRFAHSDGRITDVFHVKPIYYEAVDGTWRPMSEIAAHHGNRDIILHPSAMRKATFRFRQWLMKRQALLGRALRYGYSQHELYWGVQPIHEFAAATLIAYPDPDPETATVDGTIQTSSASWDTAHDATSGSVSDDVSQMRPASEHNGSVYIIRRTFTLFDTSAIGSSGTVTAADLDLYAFLKVNGDNDGDDFMRIVSASTASNTALTTTDYNDCGDAVDNPTAHASDVDITSISTSAYQTFALNATGLSNINKTGVSKFGCREGHDCVDSAVTTSTSSYVSWTCAESTNDPTLTVTYTTPFLAAWARNSNGIIGALNA